MARKGWTALSPTYRARLERNGITRSAYERGESIKGARGHSKTPEHPSQAKRNPQNFAEYVSERISLEQKLIAKKDQVFSGSPKYNSRHSQKNVKSDDRGKFHSKKAMQDALTALDNYDGSTDWWDLLDDEVKEILRYH